MQVPIVLGVILIICRETALYCREIPIEIPPSEITLRQGSGCQGSGFSEEKIAGSPAFPEP
jgi:hypothetical protein